MIDLLSGSGAALLPLVGLLSGLAAALAVFGAVFLIAVIRKTKSKERKNDRPDPEKNEKNK